MTGSTEGEQDLIQPVRKVRFLPLPKAFKQYMQLDEGKRAHFCSLTARTGLFSADANAIAAQCGSPVEETICCSGGGILHVSC